MHSQSSQKIAYHRPQLRRTLPLTRLTADSRPAYSLVPSMGA